MYRSLKRFSKYGRYQRTTFENLSKFDKFYITTLKTSVTMVRITSHPSRPVSKYCREK